MNYGQMVNFIEEKVLALPCKFYHYTLDHANEYGLGSSADPGDLFPVAILPPPESTLQLSQGGLVENASRCWEIVIWFAELIDPHSIREDKERAVTAMDLLARNFVISVSDSFMSSGNPFTYVDSDSVRFSPFFTYEWNAHLTAGVALSMKVITPSTYECPLSITSAVVLNSSPSFMELTFSEPVTWGGNGMTLTTTGSQGWTPFSANGSRFWRVLLGSPVKNDTVMSLSYVQQPNNGITSLSGEQLAAFTGYPVQNLVV